MANSFIILPNDASNTGKKQRTISRSVSGETVHENVNIITDINTDAQARVLGANPTTTDNGLVVKNVPIVSSTATLTAVASSATNVTILASNDQRLGVIILNDSTQILYLKFGATASATDHTVKMLSDDYYEVPFGYTGIIDGIWASANGYARITELT